MKQYTKMVTSSSCFLYTWKNRQYYKHIDTTLVKVSISIIVSFCKFVETLSYYCKMNYQHKINNLMKQRFQNQTLSFEFSLVKVTILKPFTITGIKFTVGFKKIYQSYLLLLVVLPGLTLSCTVASLMIPAMINYDVATKAFDTEKFPQHTIPDLNSGITFIVLFSQEKPSR